MHITKCWTWAAFSEEAQNDVLVLRNENIALLSLCAVLLNETNDNHTRSGMRFEKASEHLNLHVIR